MNQPKIIKQRPKFKVGHEIHYNPARKKLFMNRPTWRVHFVDYENQQYLLKRTTPSGIITKWLPFRSQGSYFIEGVPFENQNDLLRNTVQ